MSSAMIGGLVGGALGIVNFIILQNVAKSMALKSGSQGNSRPATLLRWAAWIDLIIFPLIGYFIGPMIAA